MKREQIHLRYELLPCPFCGGKAEEELTVTEYAITCASCPARMVVDAAKELIAVDQWNRRNV